MKILEICPFSSGICGVWSRVKQEAKELIKKGNQVYVFSSNIEKGTNKIVPPKENLDRIDITRFSSKGSLSENVKKFEFQKTLAKLNPDRVITHLLHPHSFKALETCRKLKIPCYLVTHAPFAVKRSFSLNLATNFYYKFKVKPNINKFTKIISITKWELPYLQKLGIDQEKVEYIPNGIPSDFFKEKIKKFNSEKIMFLGRIAPVKNLETLIVAFKKLNNPKLKLEIIGPIEKGYERIKYLGSQNIIFSKPIYNMNEKIQRLQEADIFVLPSKREAMPQSLIEAMALGKIVIASDTFGAKDLISPGKNGFLFKIGDSEGLKQQIHKALTMADSEKKLIQERSKEFAKNFKLENTTEKTLDLIR
jgi:glycosyltransferase involved in cell wall biosynthesis